MSHIWGCNTRVVVKGKTSRLNCLCHPQITFQPLVFPCRRLHVRNQVISPPPGGGGGCSISGVGSGLPQGGQMLRLMFVFVQAEFANNFLPGFGLCSLKNNFLGRKLLQTEASPWKSLILAPEHSCGRVLRVGWPVAECRKACGVPLCEGRREVEHVNMSPQMLKFRCQNRAGFGNVSFIWAGWFPGAWLLCVTMLQDIPLGKWKGLQVAFWWSVTRPDLRER